MNKYFRHCRHYLYTAIQLGIVVQKKPYIHVSEWWWQRSKVTLLKNRGGRLSLACRTSLLTSTLNSRCNSWCHRHDIEFKLQLNPHQWAGEASSKKNQSIVIIAYTDQALSEFGVFLYGLSHFILTKMCKKTAVLTQLVKDYTGCEWWGQD